MESRSGNLDDVKSPPRSLGRPRFTIRGLLIVTLLIASYFGAWVLTKKYGMRTIPNASISPLPFVVCSDELHIGLMSPPIIDRRRQYHLWLFGFSCELPLATSRRFVEPD
jgi:hypothetical protein